MNFVALLVKLQRSPRFGISSSSEGIALAFFQLSQQNKDVKIKLFYWFFFNFGSSRQFHKFCVDVDLNDTDLWRLLCDFMMDLFVHVVSCILGFRKLSSHPFVHDVHYVSKLSARRILCSLLAKYCDQQSDTVGLNFLSLVQKLPGLKGYSQRRFPTQ